MLTLCTASTIVPAEFGLGAGFTSTTLPCTTEPAGTTTCPERSLTSLETVAVNESPALAVFEVMVSLTAISSDVPADSVYEVGAAGAAGFAGAAGRGAGAFVCGAGAGCVAAGTSPLVAVDSWGTSVRLRAVESALPACLSLGAQAAIT